MEFKGTKGVWRIGVLGSVQNERGEFICESERNKATDEENNANNLLISCAPEMLEKLINIRDWIDKDINVSECRTQIDELIKKATII